jgi:NurA-like 5'-3' nuclease
MNHYYLCRFIRKEFWQPEIYTNSNRFTNKYKEYLDISGENTLKIEI